MYNPFTLWVDIYCMSNLFYCFISAGLICGHLIPAGTGQREFEKIIVGSKEEYDRILANRKNVLDYSEVE